MSKYFKFLNKVFEGGPSYNGHNIKNIFPMWVATASVVGGLSSGYMILSEICNEPKIKYKNKFIEVPLRFTYQTSRVGAHVGWGSFIGGFTAATAPVSIPVYLYWRSDEDKDKDKDNDNDNDNDNDKDNVNDSKCDNKNNNKDFRTNINGIRSRTNYY